MRKLLLLLLAVSVFGQKNPVPPVITGIFSATSPAGNSCKVGVDPTVTYTIPNPPVDFVCGPGAIGAIGTYIAKGNGSVTSIAGAVNGAADNVAIANGGNGFVCSGSSGLATFLCNATVLSASGNGGVTGILPNANMNIGTSGATIPLLNGNNTHSGTSLVSGSFSPSGSGTINSNRVNSGAIPASSPCLNTNGSSQISAVTCAAGAVPPQAAGVGYNTQTFYSAMASADFDLAESYPAGKLWYFYNFFGQTPAPSSSAVFGQNFVSLGGTGVESRIATIGINGATWHGTAFGGGAYIEAVCSYNPQNVMAQNNNGGWPTCPWAMSQEHLTGQGVADQWPGQAAGYTHFIEIDPEEYSVWSFNPITSYTATVHDWYGPLAGLLNVTNGSGGGTVFSNNTINPLATTDFNSYHRFGFLWVPAIGTNNRVGGIVSYSSGGITIGTGTCSAVGSGGGGSGAIGQFMSTAGTISGSLAIFNPGTGYSAIPTSWTLSNGTANCSGTATTTGGTLSDGYLIPYFDGQPTTGGVEWTQYNGTQSPPPGSATWTFGVMDVQHLGILFSTGVGMPMNIRSLTVWQASNAGNITQ